MTLPVRSIAAAATTAIILYSFMFSLSLYLLLMFFLVVRNCCLDHAVGSFPTLYKEQHSQAGYREQDGARLGNLRNLRESLIDDGDKCCILVAGPTATENHVFFN